MIDKKRNASWICFSQQPIRASFAISNRQRAWVGSCRQQHIAVTCRRACQKPAVANMHVCIENSCYSGKSPILTPNKNQELYNSPRAEHRNFADFLIIIINMLFTFWIIFENDIVFPILGSKVVKLNIEYSCTCCL